MAKLTLHLTEGFDGEPVTVRVRGREVFHSDDVRTSPLTDLAATVEADVPPGAVEIEVGLRERELRSRFFVQLGEQHSAVVWVGDEGIQHVDREEPYGFG